MRLPFRILVTTALLLACVVTGVAVATPADDAQATAARFLDAWAIGDGATACAQLTVGAINRFGGAERCKETFAASDDTAAVSRAIETLARGYSAAKKSARKRSGRFVTKRFKITKLAAAIEQLDSGIDVRIGTGPKAAAGQLVTTFVLDKRTSSRRLVAYVEADDGAIMRLNGTYGEDPEIDQAGEGIPETPPPASASPEPFFNYTFVAATALSESRYFVEARLSNPENESEAFIVSLVIVNSDGAWLIDDILLSLALLASG